jgi:cell division protein FtsB
MVKIILRGADAKHEHMVSPVRRRASDLVHFAIGSTIIKLCVFLRKLLGQRPSSRRQIEGVYSWEGEKSKNKCSNLTALVVYICRYFAKQNAILKATRTGGFIGSLSLL